MRKFLTSGWRRYALAFVVVGASLGVMGAQCQPTKPPPSASPCINGIDERACLTIEPTEWTFTSNGESKTFTVTNLGPDQTLPLSVSVPSIGFLAQNDTCTNKTLVQGDLCTVDVQATDIDSARGKVGHILVGSGNTQVNEEFGQRGVSAHLLAS
jgi:hypothetical protein